ncbi:MAG: glycosyltransferase family 4 protein [Actinomycetota bacterium]|nr:glycosyltransferase family 4 protein [Actinomycetota bacterium]
MNRILLLTPAFPPASGGIERTAGELAGGLGDCRVEVVSGAPPPSARTGMDAPARVRVHWAANDPPGGRRATAAVVRRAVAVGLRFKPDLVLALHLRTLPAARALRHLRGTRTILVIHASEVREQPALARAAVRWADAVVAVSEFARELALESRADPDRIRVINPGVRPPALVPPPLAARPRPLTVLTVARMNEPYKGHDVALAAMERLRSRVPEVRWIMVGDGPLRPALREAAARMRLSDSVLFPGTVDDRALERYFSAAHVFCLLSRAPRGEAAGEGFGIAFAEAAAHGLPAVAGRAGGAVDAVRDGVTGLLVDPEDPAAAALALERLLTNTELSQSFGDAGVERARELAWPTVIERYQKLISEVLAAPRRDQSSEDLAWLRDLAAGLRPGT